MDAGTEVEFPAQWPENGTDLRLLLAWHSARRRAHAATTGYRRATRELAEQRSQLAQAHRDLSVQQTELRRAEAQLSTHLRQFQVHASWSGWVPDPEEPVLWRWREGWWHLAYRKPDIHAGVIRLGWYLWGPSATEQKGHYCGRRKGDAQLEAERVITHHLTARDEVDND